MIRIIAIFVGLTLAWPALAQNKVFSSSPRLDSLPLKQLEVNIEFLQRELQRLGVLIKEMEPTVLAMQSCHGAGLIYAPGAAGMGVGSDGNDAGSVADGCVPLTGGAVVTEIKATTATTHGDMSTYGSHATARMQGFINANGCPSVDGWRPCSDDEVIFSLDQRVGSIVPTSIIDDSTYWVRSMMPFRFDQTDASATATSLNCSGWTSNTAPSGSPYNLAGTMFDGNSERPIFDFGSCAVARKILCCR